jgi:hypothetical protein
VYIGKGGFTYKVFILIINSKSMARCSGRYKEKTKFQIGWNQLHPLFNHFCSNKYQAMNFE